MSDKNKEFLRRVLFTLEQVEVKGKSNLDHLLGAMLTLEQLISEEEDDG